MKSLENRIKDLEIQMEMVAISLERHNEALHKQAGINEQQTEVNKLVQEILATKIKH